MVEVLHRVTEPFRRRAATRLFRSYRMQRLETRGQFGPTDQALGSVPQPVLDETLQASQAYISKTLPVPILHVMIAVNLPRDLMTPILSITGSFRSCGITRSWQGSVQ
jgi:hypothetical protein